MIRKIGNIWLWLIIITNSLWILTGKIEALILFSTSVVIFFIEHNNKRQK